MKNRVSANTIIVEVISIMFAVIIGFIVNEWRENTNNKSNAELAIKRIKIEMEQNYEQLQSKQNYYNNMIDVLDSLISISGNSKISSAESIPGWKGINPPMLTFSSYKTASSIGIFSFIDFTTADHISKVYLIQDELHKLGTTSINSLISGELNNYNSLNLLFVVYTELIKGWMAAYNQALEINIKRDIKNN